jgi:SulP family sulfate permease
VGRLARNAPTAVRRDSRPRFRLEPHDVLAAVSVALVLVPQSLAYAQLAGFPAYRGLYAAAIPPLVAAPFASSPYLQPGPTAVSALLTYGALATLAPLGSTRYVELGLLLALLVGVIRIAVGLLRTGVLAYLISEPLMVGFVPAAAIPIVASQLPLALGVHARGTNELYRAGWSLEHVGS